MFHDPHSVHELLHQLAQRRLVEGTARLLGAGVERDGGANRQVYGRANAAYVAAQVALANAANLPQRERAGEQGWQQMREPTHQRRDTVIGAAGDTPAGLTEHGLGVWTTADEPRDTGRFLKARTLPALDRLVVAANLRVHGLAQAKALDAQFLNELRLQLPIGQINGPDGFEEGEWDERIDGSGHEVLAVGGWLGTVGKVNG